MKEADPGRGQGLRLRPRQRGITPGKSLAEGARVPESDQGLAQDPGQETGAGRHREALQEPGPGPQEEDPVATRDPRYEKFSKEGFLSHFIAALL